MRGIHAIVCFSVVTQAWSAQDSVDTLVDRMFDRTLTSSPHRQSGMDGTALGKSGSLATSRSGPVSLAMTRPGSTITRPAVSSGRIGYSQLSGASPRHCGCQVTCAAFDGSSYPGRCSEQSRPGATIVSGPLSTRRAGVAHAAETATPGTKDKKSYVRPFYKGTKQVVSLGPKTFAKDKIMELFLAGADVFRINLSHGREEKADVIKTIREVEAEVGYPIGVLADLQGPKQRCGMFKDDAKFELTKGMKFRFDADTTEGDATRVHLPHPEILQALNKGNTLLIDDGKIVMKVLDSGDDWVECEVEVPGTISSRKGVNTPDTVLPMSPITEKDEIDLNFILNYEPDFVALSFVQLADDMKQLRQKIADHPNAHKPKIISKIEKPVAIDNLKDIVEFSDAIMVARGDLGVEMDIAEVPLMQKLIVAEARKQAKPVIMATQMLESMMEAPSPTRAEASDVAAAVFDGVDAVMLSGESAAGKFPRESVAMQQRIITTTENSDTFRMWRQNQAQSLLIQDPDGEADSTLNAARGLAENIKAKCLVDFTCTGFTAGRLSRFLPSQPILAITPSVAAARSLTLNNYVYPAVLSSAWDGSRQRFSVLVDEAVGISRAKGLVSEDSDKMVITGGLPFGEVRLANVIRVVQAVGPDCWESEGCADYD